MKIPVLSWSVAAALGLPLIAQAAVPAAVVAKIEGNAVATQGERYVTVHDGMRLVEGDRLMVLEGVQAVVTFSDGCRLDLPEMAILSVQASSTCALNDGGTYQVDADSGVAAGKSPKPQLAAIQPNTPSSNVTVAQTGTTGGTSTSATTGGTVATTGGTGGSGLTTVLTGTTMVGTTAVPTVALAGGLLAVTGGVVAATNSTNNNNPPNPVSP